jgi:FAD/FMN-containing dehydrogenase/Fe-S oxidoreductase
VAVQRNNLNADSALAIRLAQNIQGEILFDPGSRGRYSTDASIYQIQPIGVVVPKTVEDVAACIEVARDAGVPVLPRGGGTSQCGQTVNKALVVDCSKYLRQILDLDVKGRTATVEPGIVLGHLNSALRKHGLFFPVDPSTHARCTIGGMTGNNSCGSKSIRYGLMADNVLAIDALLSDGTPFRFDSSVSSNFGEQTSTRIIDLVQRLQRLGIAEAAEIEARFPTQLRRVGGYNIDVLTHSAKAAGRDNLARLLVGSEGTLAFSTAIELQLQPIKPRKVLGICQFPTFRAAMKAARHIVALDPEAVELVDRTMIDLGRAISIYRPTIDRMLLGEPNSLLLVEFHGWEDAHLAGKLNELNDLMLDLGNGCIVSAVDPAFQADIAAVREAGLNIMMSMKGDGKPISFIEDCAVNLDDLPAYTDALNEIFERHGTSGTWYAHASVGCLHVRPVLNMKDPADVAKMRSVAEETFALVRSYKGSHSGEHGDGIVRSEFHESMFGTQIVEAFETVKRAFDPIGLLNPNRIVQAPAMDDRSLFRYSPNYAPTPSFVPKLDWSDHPGALGGMLGAVEMCNNNGTCRSFDAGVMCPSYRVTRDETDVTRGRANTLRLALTGQLGPDAVDSDSVASAMSLCVSCKACKHECPTGVDMAKMKIEVLAARAEQPHLRRWRDLLIGGLPTYARFASRFSAVANLRNVIPPLRHASEHLFGLSAKRNLPRWSRTPFKDEELSRTEGRRGKVYVFADTFSRYFEPENLRSLLRVLAAAGYQAVMPAVGERPICCGRTWLSIGRVDRARSEARWLMQSFPLDLPIIGLEPSCVMTLRDDFRSLLPGPETTAFGNRAMLLSEFLARQKVELPMRTLPGVAWVHGHCHQKAFGAFPDALEAMQRVPGLIVNSISSSCCGMAGSFGYQKETEATSRAMGEAALLPVVRSAALHDYIVADGTSCRHQIQDLSGRTAIHSVQLLATALAEDDYGSGRFCS